MRIIIETIPHDQQRYETVGDWQFKTELVDPMPEAVRGTLEFAASAAGSSFRNVLHIQVSETGDDDMNFLIGLHEAVEAMLCRRNGISEAMVDHFDKQFIPDEVIKEPGDDPQSPYYYEHQFASCIERLMAQEIGVHWPSYEITIETVMEKKSTG